MSFSGFLGALLFVCVGVAVVAGAWIAVRWAGRRWPNGVEEVDAGPFASWRAGLEQLRDSLRTMDAELVKLRTENQLIRQEWGDYYSKIRRAEERTRKARQRARDDDDEEEEEADPRQFPMFVPAAHAPNLPATLETPAEPEVELPKVVRRFHQKYGNGRR